MKGIVFNEFFALVDDVLGPDVTEKIITEAQLPNSGAYTGVGYYDASEMVKLVKCLHTHTGTPIPDLLHTFGKHLLASFKSAHSQYFASCDNVLDFVGSVEQQIHVDVLKLYPDAELPRLTASTPKDGRMTLDYQSGRRMADLAEGLLWGAIDHYGEIIDVERVDLPDADGDQCARFILTRR